MYKNMLSFALLALPLCAGDVSGKWSATLTSNGKVIPLHLELCQQGEQVAGALGMRGDFMSLLENVRMAGSALVFDFRIPMGPAIKFEGTVDGDSASGKLSFSDPAQTGKLEMKRIGRASRLPATFDPPAKKDDLAALSDEFDNPGALKNWKTLSAAEGWPNRIEKLDVNATSAGQLHVVPQSGAWWAGYHGVYFFKEVKGDFVLSTRVKVTGRSGAEPARIWTISGLLVRAPADAKVPREQRKENWIYVMTGRGPGDGRVIDAKSTLDSINAWDVTPAEAGWYDLRIARAGPLFIVLCRPDGGEWALRKRIVREDLPETLQAGINVTSDFKLSSSMPAAKYNAELFPDASSPDSATTFEFVRFSRLAGTPELRSKLAGKEVVGVSDTDLLAFFPVSAAAGNPVVGKWDLIATDTAGQATSWTLAVNEDGGKLTGTLIGTEVTLPLVDPKLDGESFTFKVLVNEQAYQVETKVEGKRLEGKYKGPEASGTIKASKQS